MSKFHPLTVAETRPETRDSMVVRFEAPAESREAFRYRAGQHLILRAKIDGEEVRRSYSICAGEQEQSLRIAIKRIDDGLFSNWAAESLTPGSVIEVMEPSGHFNVELAPEAARHHVAFAAGSGITPIASMLRGLVREHALRDVVHVHCSRTAEGVIFAQALAQLRRTHGGYRLHVRLTSSHGRLTPQDLQAICPDWAERETFVCGPAGLLETLGEHWRAEGAAERLHTERFQPDARVGEGERGCGGTISLCRSGVEAVSDGEQPILAAGEAAGAAMPFGCRMGICHSCVGRLRSGQVRDLRTGRVHGAPGELLRTCINAPEGAIEIDL